MRQQDQMVKTPKGGQIRWNDYCKFLLDIKKNQQTEKGFVEEILDMQGIKYQDYLAGTRIDKAEAV